MEVEQAAGKRRSRNGHAEQISKLSQAQDMCANSHEYGSLENGGSGAAEQWRAEHWCEEMICFFYVLSLFCFFFFFFTLSVILLNGL